MRLVRGTKVWWVSSGRRKRFIEEVQRAVADGWDQTLAESRAGFIIWGQAAGKTYDQAFADYARYEKAVRDGNTAIIAQIEDEYAAYRKLAEMMDQVYDTAVSAYDRAKAAGISAYDEVFQAAIESGKGQEEATAQALAAQEAAIAELLAAEKEKYVFLAVREAVLEAIRSGNAEGAAEAGRKAARETREAWDTAMDVIAEADQVATDAMTDNSTVRADHAIAESDRWTSSVIDDIGNIPTLKTVDIVYHGSRTGNHVGESGVEGRQHGGPVSAGVPYRVGERGEEIFVPGQLGVGSVEQVNTNG